MAVAFSLFGNLGLQTKDLETGSKKAKAELQSLTGTVLGGVNALATSLTGLAAGAVGLAAIKSGLEGIVRTGQEMERLRNSFTAITGSAQAGRQEFAFVSQTANRLGFDVQALAEQYRGLMAATRGTQLAGTDTQQLFVSLSQASRAYGLSTEQTGRALLAFQQIISKGKVSQEELRGQLGEALPGASQIAARAFGVTTQELDKMVEKGLDATEFTRRFTAQLSKETPAAVDQVGAGIKQLGNELVAWKDRMAKEGVLKVIDDLAAAGGRLLAAGRGAAENQAQITQRDMSRALQGEDLGNLRPEDRNELMAIVEQRLALEETIRGASVVPLEVEQSLERLNRAEERIRVRIQERRTQMKQSEEGGKLLTEIGPQFEAQERARLKQIADDKVRQMEADKNRVVEIQNRTEERIKLEEEEEDLVKRSGDLRKQLTREEQAAEEQALDTLRKKLDAETLTEDALRRKTTLQAVSSRLAKQEADELLFLLDVAKKVELQVKQDQEELAFFTEVEKAVRKEQEDTAKAVEKIRERVGREIEREETARLRQQERMADRLGDALLQPFEDLATGSEVSFQQVAQNFSRMIVQMTLEASGFKKVLNDLIGKGITALGDLFKPRGSTPVSETTAPTFTPEVQGSFASGGYMMPRGFYQVHQDEVIYSGSTGGTVIPAAQARQMGGVTLNMTVVTQDAGSFVHDQARVQRAAMSLLQASARNG